MPPPILITNNCNRRCPFCFLGKWKDEPILEMSVDDVCGILSKPDFSEPYFFNVFSRRRLWQSIKIMGGEPTRHPKFKEIMNVCRKFVQNDGAISVLTNGIMDREIAEFISPFNKLINISVNYTGGELEKILSTLKTWQKDPHSRPFIVAFTITEPDQDISLLKNVIKRNRKVKWVRLAISSPGVNFENDSPFCKGDENPEYGSFYLRVASEIRNIRSDIGLVNECCVNNKLMDDETFEKLNKKYNVWNLKRQCFIPNFDILPDMSADWCSAFMNVPEMRVENILRYDDLGIVKAELFKKFYTLCKKLNFDPYNDESGCIARKYHEHSLKLNTKNAL